MAEVDPVLYEVVRSQLDGIVQEMQIAMYRTGYSTLIRETHDMSCGIVDVEGRVVAQFAGIPIHLGSYPACIQGLYQYYNPDEMEEGDCFFVNHPFFSGCAHSLDSAAITPVFHHGELVAFCIGITHKGDIGGLSPGSRSVQARDIFGEGMLVPPVKYISRRRVVKETENLIWANTRTPQLLLGDYNAQAGPEWSVGNRRLLELMDRYGRDTVLTVFQMVGDKTEQHLRADIAAWQDGTFEAEAYLDNDMVDLDKPVRLHVALTKKGDSLTLDFSATSDQNRGAHQRPSTHHHRVLPLRPSLHDGQPAAQQPRRPPASSTSSFAPEASWTPSIRVRSASIRTSKPRWRTWCSTPWPRPPGAAATPNIAQAATSPSAAPGPTACASSSTS